MPIFEKVDPKMRERLSLWLSVHKTIRAIIVPVLLVLAPTSEALSAGTDTAIGFVKEVVGHTTLSQNGERRSAAAGTKIYLNDMVETDSVGSVGIVFDDGSTLSLGNDSKIKLDEFVYEPADGIVGQSFQMLQGMMLYVSGQITKVDHEAVRVNTPVATIGIRGTRFILRLDD